MSSRKDAHHAVRCVDLVPICLLFPRRVLCRLEFLLPRGLPHTFARKVSQVGGAAGKIATIFLSGGSPTWDEKGSEPLNFATVGRFVSQNCIANETYNPRCLSDCGLAESRDEHPPCLPVCLSKQRHGRVIVAVVHRERNAKLPAASFCVGSPIAPHLPFTTTQQLVTHTNVC